MRGARKEGSPTPATAVLVVAPTDSDVVACEAGRDSLLAAVVPMHRVDRWDDSAHLLAVDSGHFAVPSAA